MKLKYSIILIFILGFILRFWQLGQNPPSLDWDEASLGYNAFSILKSGRDEYGKFMPLSIQSFNDHKPPLYTYLTTVAVAMLGLNEISTRFLSAFLGSLTVIVVYFLVKELFPSKHSLFFVLCSLLFAISPWHIQFSRIAFEANIAVFFTSLGILLFLISLRREMIHIWAFLSFVLSIYSYHSARLVIPLLIIGLLLIYRKEIRNSLKGFIVGISIFIILFIPIIGQFSSSTAARFGSVTVINAQEKLGESIKAIEFDKKTKDALGVLVHNRRIIYAREILAGYLDHFNFDFLFLTGDAPGRHHATGMGMLYFWDLPFLLLGIYFMIRQRDKGSLFLFWWFLVAPSASALTSGTPHAVRSLMYLPTHQIFITAGVLGILKLFYKNSKPKLICKLTVYGLLLLNFFYYLHMYYIHTPREYSQWWQYGYEQVVAEISKYEADFDKIIVTYRYDQPYIYFLFYQQIDPLWYQKNWGEGEINRAKRSFGKYEFRNIDWPRDSQLTNTLLVGTSDEVPQAANGILSEIYFLDGSVAFRIVAR